MGIDYRSVIMYGKEFESYDQAMDHLLNTNKYTTEQYEDAMYCGEPDGNECEWVVYNALCGGPGVLGESFSARTAITKPEVVREATKNMDALIGEGCSMHEFVSVT